MVQQLSKTDVIYPDSDGQPMSDNTLKFQWIVDIKENLEFIFKDEPDVFVAGDLLWYPVEGDSKTRQAPDAMVAFGRPKGYRGSYMQWKEAGIAPQVVFEILSPGNRTGEMSKKFQFYQKYGVQEYYVYDPYDIELIGWQSAGQRLEIIPEINGWISPALKIRFVMTAETLKIYRPDGKPFTNLAESETARAQAEAQRNQAEAQRNQAQARADKLAAQLKALGIDPDEG